MENLDKNLKLVIVNGKINPAHLNKNYLSAYEYWHLNWSTTMQKKEKNFILASDSFLRQEEILILYYFDEPIAMVALDYFRLDIAPHQNHSYAKNIPEKALQSISLKQDCEFMTFSQLLVTKVLIDKILVSDLISSLAIFRLLFSKMPQALCYTRNRGRVNKLSQRWGGEVLVENFILNDEPSDFLIFDRTSFHKSKLDNIKEIAKKVWSTALFENSPINLSHKLGIVEQHIIKQLLEEVKNEKNINRSISL